MPRSILVDASHPEQTRVVLLENGRVQELDSETLLKKQIKGNVYLAKVTRVEPSLQACFVEYGVNKHGFLPFAEIHPDYYQIPVADKQELIQQIRDQGRSSFDDDEEFEGAAPASEEGTENRGRSGRNKQRKQEDNSEEVNEDKEGETEEREEFSERLQEDSFSVDPSDLYRRYKIQEVIKRNQIVLVQVEKEERGTKGASMTTFISLAGRYCVLMPNALRRGGISRRISNFEDRRRLRKLVRELNLSDDANIIIRTAGAGRGDEEIKADYDYLSKLWNSIREKTLSSTAPAFIHEEANILRRTIRDLYAGIDEMWIEGKEAFAKAKEFVEQVMPGQVDNVQEYTQKTPILTRYKVEEQIHALYEQEAYLESGGYIVINPTEALISIDVNSGKSTSQRNVEETALSTNLEAAKEIARQLRLRDLSGLIVVDFIDMMELKNRKAVERAFKDACQEDRAKIQIGRISIFGLLEMSRQRLGPSFYEINTKTCPQCRGRGTVKAAESVAVTVLRAVESELNHASESDIIHVSLAIEVAFYVLNHKASHVRDLEERYGVSIVFSPDKDGEYDSFSIERKRRSDPASGEKGGRDKRRKREHERDRPRPQRFDQPKQAESSDNEGDEPRKEEENSHREEPRQGHNRRREDHRRDRRESKNREERHSQAKAEEHSGHEQVTEEKSERPQPQERENRRPRRGGGKERVRRGSSRERPGSGGEKGGSLLEGLWKKIID